MQGRTGTRISGDQLVYAQAVKDYSHWLIVIGSRLESFDKWNCVPLSGCTFLSREPGMHMAVKAQSHQAQQDIA